MTTRTNNAFGQPVGTVATAAATGDTGGVSGDYFNTITTNGGSTVKFDADSPHGGRSFALDLTSASTTFVAWSGLSFAQTTTRFYIKFETLNGSAIRFWESLDTAGASMMRLLVSAAGKFIVQTNGGNSTPHTWNTSVVANQWYRVELVQTKGTTGAVVSVDFYLGDSIIPIETGYSNTGQNLASANNLGQQRFGSGAGTYTSNDRIWIADVDTKDTDQFYFGPAAGLGSIPASVRVTGTVATANASSVNVTNPAGAVVGDLLVLAISDSQTGTGTTPTGWTSIGSFTVGSTSPLTLSVYAKACVAGDAGSTVTYASTSTGKKVAWVTAIQNADLSGGLSDAIGVFYSDTTSNNTRALPSVTSVVSNTLALAFVADRAAGTAPNDIKASTTAAFPGSWTLSNSGVTGTVANAGDVSLFAITASLTTPGVSPSGNVVLQYTNVRYNSIVFTVKSKAAAPIYPQIGAWIDGAWVTCDILGLGNGTSLDSVTIASTDVFATPDFLADFNDGTIPSFFSTVSNATVDDAYGYEGKGCRLTPNPSPGFATLTMPSSKFPAGVTWASFQIHFRLASLPSNSEQYMNLFEIGNDLSDAPKGQFTCYFNARSLWVDFNLEDAVPINLTPAVGVWHTIEARVSFATNSYSALVRVDGGATQLVSSGANKTPAHVAALWIHYPTVNVDYTVDLDLIKMAVRTSDPGWMA